MAQGGWTPPPGGLQGQYSPQHGYQPQPGPPPGGTASAQSKGLFAGLFDFSFETFVALKVVKVLYGLFLVVLVLGLLGGLGGAVISFTQGEAMTGLGILVALPFAGVIYLVLGRVYFELIIVAFKIAEDADEIAKNTRR
jgi:hypothetical protein